jgi:hypothetical protein
VQERAAQRSDYFNERKPALGEGRQVSYPTLRAAHKLAPAQYPPAMPSGAASPARLHGAAGDVRDLVRQAARLTAGSPVTTSGPRRSHHA